MSENAASAAKAAQTTAKEATPAESIAKKQERYTDVTGKWYEEATPNSHVVQDLQAYTVNGVTYKVGGTSVVLDYSPHEKEIAELIEKEFGGEMYMVPRVNNPQGVSTPDYLFRGVAYDLKTISSIGKKILYDRISRKKHNQTISSST